MAEADDTLRIVAIDDERLALLRVETVVEQIAGAELVGTAMSAEAGLELVRLKQPDVLLLDVEMEQMGGFQMLAAMDAQARPSVIFITAHDSFAVQAFEVDAVDYVLKPLERGRLSMALDRARLHRGRRAQAPPAPPRGLGKEFWVEQRGMRVRVPIEAIEWLEAERDYVRLHTAGGTFLMRGPLSRIVGRLDPAAFLRVRRSAVVRLDAVKAVRTVAAGHLRLLLRSGEELRVGDTYVTAVQQLFRWQAV